MELINKKSLERLKFQQLLNRIEPFSSYGKKLLIDLKPYTKGQEKELELEYDRLENVMLFAQENDLDKIEHDLYALKNIRSLLENTLRVYVLDEVDFFEIKNQALLFENLRQQLQHDLLSHYHLRPLQDLIKLLDPNNENTASFHFYNSYSPSLSKVREEKKKLEQKIFHAPTEDKRKQLLLERSTILVKEEQEEYYVREHLSRQIEEYIPDFLENVQKIAAFDLALAKVKFAREFHCVRPKIAQKNVLVEGKGLINIRVKEILEKEHHHYTPIDISLRSGSTLITGANMGGKSVALSTIVENLLLCHYGFFVAATEATFSLMELIQFISEDMQDVSQGLSSFGAEIYQLKETTPYLKTKQCFLVFDEFARGTNPQEGQKFVRGLMSYLNQYDSISLMTSHFDGVVEPHVTHYQVIGLKNVDVQQLQKKITLGISSISIIQEYMDYRLEKTHDQKVPKDAFHVAQLIGLDQELSEIIQKEYQKESENDQ